MAHPFGDQKGPFCSKGKWEFNLSGETDRHTVKVVMLKGGFLAVCEEELRDIKGINLSGLVRLGHAPHFVEAWRLVWLIDEDTCCLITD